VEGAPLALELAAAWAKLLSCAEIVTELTHGIAILTSNLRNVGLAALVVDSLGAIGWLVVVGVVCTAGPQRCLVQCCDA
jgi:hypothetical protein